MSLVMADISLPNDMSEQEAREACKVAIEKDNDLAPVAKQLLKRL